MYYKYIDNKKSKDILLIHSIPSSSQLFKKHIPVLSSQFNILLVDLPGFGKSNKYNNFDIEEIKTKILNIIGELKLDNLYVWGISLGGIVAIELSQHFKFKQMIIESSPAYFQHIKTQEFRAVTLFKKLLIRLKVISVFTYILHNYEFVRWVIINIYRYINWGHLSYSYNFMNNFVKEINVETFFKAVTFLRKFDNRDLIKKINIPFIFILDEGDPVVHLKDVLKTYDEIKGIKYLSYNYNEHAPSVIYGVEISKDVLKLIQ